MGRVIATLTDYGLTVAEEVDAGIRAFFATVRDRDEAAGLLASEPSVTTSAVMVSDEAWAERSQAALKPVRVGGIVIRPPWADETSATDGRQPTDVVITIQPSMGFGTGHHQSTRLCLRCLQGLAVKARAVLDVGTGSGVLSIAAAKLGAARVVGIDADPDALTSAAENLDLNDAAGKVELRQLEVSDDTPPPIALGADVITANLSGALLERLARQFVRWLRPDGTLVASGFQLHEEDAVADALRRANLHPTGRLVEDDWVALTASPTPSRAR